MRRYSFATIVSVKDGLPVATHLPFLVKEKDEKITLTSHFAKANPHSSAITGSDALVIFTEPHAYISPKNYENVESVPTWNYLAVHAYGKCLLLESERDKAAVLHEMIKYYDADYLAQWNSLAADYKQKMMRGIVAFEVVVDDLQAKKKLSQNRSETERQNIINDLSKATDTTERDIAGYMRSLKP